MARGWESKNIESQQEEATRDRKRQKSLTPEEQARQVEARWARTGASRAVADLDRAVAPAHRKMLEQTIAAIDAQLRELA